MTKFINHLKYIIMLSNSKVQEVTLISATNKVDNSNDAERVYDISANVTSTVATVNDINSGAVCEKGTGTPIANFNESAGGYSNISFNGQLTTDAKRAISNAVYGFIDDVKAMYANPQ